MSEPGDPPGAGARGLAAQDEILQVLYWMRGERLAEAAGAAELAPWLQLDPGAISGLLERLAAKGWLEPRGEGRFALTAAGAAEGGRRFADEFADLTRPGHGECGDADCDCRRTGDPADCLHAHPAR